MQSKEKRKVSVFSIITLVVSVLGTALYALIFKTHSTGIIILFFLFAIASIILPPISTVIRLRSNKLGMVLEIIAIVIGGFNFYCIIFAFTRIPIFFGYLGWVACGVVYGILTKNIGAQVYREQEKQREQDNKALGIARGTCEYNGVMGVLECTGSYIRFTSVTGREEVYRFEDGISVSSNNDAVTIVGKDQSKHIFKVKSPEVFRSIIEKYNKSSQQLTEQKKPDDSAPLKTLPSKYIPQQDCGPEILFCRKCGAKLISGSSFCRKCGTPVVNKGNAEQALKKTNKDELPAESKNNNEKKMVLEYNFANQDEFIIYILTHKDSIQDDKLIWTKGNQYLDTYKKGYALFEKRQYNAAISAYREALKCNPVGLAARLEIVECLIVQGRNIEAKEMLLGDLINYAQYNTTALAKVYRRLGFIYTEQKKYDLAKASFLYSSKIEKNDSVVDELRYIMSVSGDKNLDVDIISLFKRDGVPVLAVSNIYDQLEQKQVDNTKAEYTFKQNNDAKNGQITEAANEALQPKSPERNPNTGDGNAATGTPVKEVVAGEKPAVSNSVMNDKETELKDSSGDNKKKEPQKEDKKPVEHIFCRKCGKKIPADSVFCTHCGTTIIRLE